MGTGPRPLEGRVALVTGGAVRVGRSIVEALAERGADVAFTYRTSAAQAAELTRALESRGRRVLAVPCDQTREGDVDAAFRALDERFGRVDLLVNSASIFERTPFATLDLAAWQRHLDANLTGPFLFARRAGERMLAGEGGVIVNIACAGAVRPWGDHAAYCVSKAGLLMLTQTLAKALAPRVRVNAVAPGPVLMPEGYDEAQRLRAEAATVLGRAGSPDDVARAVLFCWDSDYTTGALIPVEGGRLIL